MKPFALNFFPFKTFLTSLVNSDSMQDIYTQKSISFKTLYETFCTKLCFHSQKILINLNNIASIQENYIQNKV